MKYSMALILVVLFSMVMVGCSDNDKENENPVNENPETGPYSVFQLEHDGIVREYTLYIPQTLDTTTPAPLVLNFHGYGSDMEEQMVFSDMNVTAETNGFVVAYPNGLVNAIDGPASWNAGDDCCAFGDTDRDDVGFVRAIVTEIMGMVSIDEKRIYSTGFSNGGFFSHYLACNAEDLIAAIAPVSGVLGIPQEDCSLMRSVPVMHFHGTADIIVPYDGDGMFELQSVAYTFDAWSDLNGCTGDPVETFNNGAALCETYENCDEGVEVTLCTIDGMDHCWPGQIDCPLPTTTDILANDEMWDFFQRFSLP